MPQLDLDIAIQPDETTCGPACLDAVYGCYGNRLPLGIVTFNANLLIIEPGQ